MSFHVPEDMRITDHPILGSTSENGNNGAFVIRGSNGRELAVIASDERDWDAEGLAGTLKWEHVSVHGWDGKKAFTPSWMEMCKVKDLFWDEDDVVVEFHPRKSEYVNIHPYTLHMWRPVGIELPTPPKGKQLDKTMPRKHKGNHKYQLVRWGAKKTLIYKCIKPDCPHYKLLKMALNSVNECNRCGKPHLITKNDISRKMVKPHCADCTRGSAIEPDFEDKLEALLREVE